MVVGDDSLIDTMVIEESLEIMIWALTQHDPLNLLRRAKDCPTNAAFNEIIQLIMEFEAQFIPALEAYCCAKRYHEDNLDECRSTCEITLQQLEYRLTTHAYLFSGQESLLDIALFPFLRKFARVERQWYLNSPYPQLRRWLNNYLQGPMFTKVMANHDHLYLAD